jgi:hypothetical protein
VQGAEFLDQQFAGDQFHLEIKRALHEDPDGFLLGHGILLPWECFLRHPLSLLLISSENFRENLIEEMKGLDGPWRKKQYFFRLSFLTR